jgi:hypothetical protein
MVKLALVQAAGLDQPKSFERQYTPEEVIARLEQRVGPEGGRLFKNFLRKVERLERSGKLCAPGMPSTHTDGVDDEGEE